VPPPPTTTPGAEPAAGDAVAADAVAQTERFVFRSRLAFNLHDRLLRWATEDDRGGQECIAVLDETGRRGWDASVRAFEAFGERRDPRGDVALRVRIHLFDPTLEVMDRLGDVPAWHAPAMDAAEPAYRACFWEDDDRDNRAFIASLATLLSRAEAPMAERIATIHGVQWNTWPIPVDVVPRVNFGGANTTYSPRHILISSREPGYLGVGGIEMLFHEASHTIVTPGSEGSVAALRRAAESLDVPLHRDLWHMLIFATAGFAARDVIREVFGEAYEPYMYGQGVVERAWPKMRTPLDQFWGGYMAGEITLDEAATGLVRAGASDGPEPSRAATMGMSSMAGDRGCIPNGGSGCVRLTDCCSPFVCGRGGRCTLPLD
jgi:hypothetical protein